MVNRIKLSLGILLIVLSFIGSLPIIRGEEVELSCVQSKSDPFGGFNSSTTGQKKIKNICDTNYPIVLGCFVLSGAILLASVKREK